MILVRHAESEFNVGASSHYNSRLTNKGVEQAKTTSYFIREYLRLNNKEKPFIVTSPFQRTFETSFYIALENGLEIRPNDLLVEHITQDNGFTEESHYININLIIKKCETDEEILQRMKLFWETYKNENCIVVSHGGPIGILISLAKNETVNKYPLWDGSITNCCITDTNDLEFLHKYSDHLYEGA